MNHRALATLVAILLLAAAVPRRAFAGSEEWSTFNVVAQEEDDESLLDHFLTRTPRAWRDTWEHAPLALRTAQGCLTSGQWFNRTDLKLRTSLGRRAEFGLLVRQNEEDSQSYDYTDLQFRFPTRHGTPGAWFRPFFDKSRQDFAVTWDFGADTTAQQLQLTFALEDMFNNLWAFRQSRVGGLSEPYQQRPYEPAARWVARHERWRAEASGRWLTPSRKSVIDLTQPVPGKSSTLWGTLTSASVEAEALGLRWSAATENQQALSSDTPDDGTSTNRFFRRRWEAEAAVLRQWTPTLSVKGHTLYQERDSRRGFDFDPTTFNGIDRLLETEARWAWRPGWAARVGGMVDHITIAQSGPVQTSTQGSRRETRAFFGLEATFSNVTVAGVEGIELDQEPYDVWFHHDKAFLQLQARF